MKSIVLSMLFGIFSLCAIAQNQRPEVGNVCKVYTGNEGLIITTARVGPEKNDEVLLKVEGVDHPWNGKIFKAKMTKRKSNSLNNNFDIDYEIEWEGKKYNVLTYRDQYSQFKAYMMPFGSLQVEHSLGYDKGNSSYCSSERLLTEFLEQKK